MLSEQQQRIMGYFIEEAKDHLGTIEQGLLNLQSTVEDPEMVNEVFRAAHSVKGGAAMLGIDSMQHTAHRLEDFFKILKECSVQIDQKLESLLFRVFDTLQELLEQLQGPFGLTDDKATEAMGELEPVFEELDRYLNDLVQQAGGIPAEAPMPAPRQSVQTAPVASAKSAHPEASALQLVFKSDVPEQLRAMLQFFKQPDADHARQQLQDICDRLVRAGEQFDLNPWCQLVQATRRAIANPNNTHRVLAPIVIRDLKQGQELVLAGRVLDITVSESLLELLPPEPVVAEIDEMADMLGDIDLASEEDFADLFADDEADNVAAVVEDLDLDELGSEPFDDSADAFDLDSITDSSVEEAFDLADFDAGDLEFDATDSPATDSTPAVDLPTSINQGASAPLDTERTGPEVGAAELNSLADLFEGEVPELDVTWQQEEPLDNLELAAADSFDIDVSSDFSDLLLQDTNSHQISSTEEDLTALFGEDSFADEAIFTTDAVSDDIGEPSDGSAEELIFDESDLALSFSMDLESLDPDQESSTIPADSPDLLIDELDDPEDLGLEASLELADLDEPDDLDDQIAGFGSDGFDFNDLEADIGEELFPGEIQDDEASGEGLEDEVLEIEGLADDSSEALTDLFDLDRDETPEATIEVNTDAADFDDLEELALLSDGDLMNGELDDNNFDTGAFDGFDFDSAAEVESSELETEADSGLDSFEDLAAEDLAAENLAASASPLEEPEELVFAEDTETPDFTAELQADLWSDSDSEFSEAPAAAASPSTAPSPLPDPWSEFGDLDGTTMDMDEVRGEAELVSEDNFFESFEAIDEVAVEDAIASPQASPESDIEDLLSLETTDADDDLSDFFGSEDQFAIADEPEINDADLLELSDDVDSSDSLQGFLNEDNLDDTAASYLEQLDDSALLDTTDVDEIDFGGLSEPSAYDSDEAIAEEAVVNNDLVLDEILDETAFEPDSLDEASVFSLEGNDLSDDLWQPEDSELGLDAEDPETIVSDSSDSSDTVDFDFAVFEANNSDEDTALTELSLDEDIDLALIDQDELDVSAASPLETEATSSLLDLEEDSLDFDLEGSSLELEDSLDLELEDDDLGLEDSSPELDENNLDLELELEENNLELEEDSLDFELEGSSPGLEDNFDLGLELEDSALDLEENSLELEDSLDLEPEDSNLELKNNELGLEDSFNLEDSSLELEEDNLDLELQDDDLGLEDSNLELEEDGFDFELEDSALDLEENSLELDENSLDLENNLDLDRGSEENDFELEDRSLELENSLDSNASSTDEVDSDFLGLDSDLSDEEEAPGISQLEDSSDEPISDFNVFDLEGPAPDQDDVGFDLSLFEEDATEASEDDGDRAFLATDDTDNLLSGLDDETSIDHPEGQNIEALDFDLDLDEEGIDSQASEIDFDTEAASDFNPIDDLLNLDLDDSDEALAESFVLSQPADETSGLTDDDEIDFSTSDLGGLDDFDFAAEATVGGLEDPSVDTIDTPSNPDTEAELDWNDLDVEDESVEAQDFTTDFNLEDDLAPQDNLIEEAATADIDAGLADSALDDSFTDLDALLADEQVESPASVPASSIGSTDADDFADLEALLGDEDFDGSSNASSEIPSFGADIGLEEDTLDFSADDEFEDLEKLLEDADKTLGGSPTVKGARRNAAAASRRMGGRRSGGVLSEQSMRVSVKHLDSLSNLVGELVVNRNSLEQDQERLRQFLDNLLYQMQQLSDVGQRMRDLYERSLLESSLLSSRQSYQARNSSATHSAIQNEQHATGVSFDALEMDRFTGFHSLSQEMIELIVRVREAASDIEFIVEETDQVTRNFRQVTTQLQEGLTRSRMVPFAQTADRLPRAVRDISLKCGKQAELQIEGRDTLIDKMILEQLYDPMTHLVNNAITHGVESPEVRKAAGKPEKGQIQVRAFHQGNQTVIVVSDDGAGINPDIVKEKAVRKGLITPNEARNMSHLDVYDLLFHPGFSTRDQADDFAGRGVGMDVVRTRLAEMRGAINIDSTVGQGTSFTIRLPLTLSISKALACISNRARIAFPMDGVEDMLDVPKERIQINGEGQPCILWRDTLLPFQPLADLLKYNRQLGRGSVYGGGPDDEVISIVVLRSAGTHIALQVDQVLGEQEIVIKQLQGPVPKPLGVAGATVLGDGRIMPIGDVLELIDLSMGRIRRDANSSLWEQGDEQIPPEEIAIKTEPTVLIVDDSITVRELLSMSFNKVGYRVEQARDGQEAWEKLRSGLPCDLVFCDIEMPRMDGLELLSRLQKDPQLNHLPIAMLTSRGADRHRQMAVDLGASGYFTKPYLEEALLDAAQRMLKGEVLVHRAEENNA